MIREAALVIAVAAMVAGCARPEPLPEDPFGHRSPTPSAVIAPAASSPRAQSASPSPVRSSSAMPGPPAGALEARVVDVTDGDTIVLRGIRVGEVHRATGGRKSRLIGIDTPETFSGPECFGAEASAFTRRELQGKQVLVAFDVDPVDRYGRALVYIWKEEGVFFNGRLAAEGFAQQLTVPPNVRYAELFTVLVRTAREADRGLWGGCDTH